MTLNSGALLSDRYRLLRLIATGGMGQVWEADDAVLDRHVAVKVLKAEYSSDAEFVERFRSEAKVTARISHPGIATVYDYGQIDDPSSGRPLSYLVMELVVGEPLSDVLAREGTLPLRHTLDMLEQTGHALNAAHAIGLVHRDVKPGNILITPTGQVKLTDFGIAKSMGASAVTQTGMVVGTAQYIAPEQAMGYESTPAGDVYSLGVVGYECLAGRRPFVADSPVTIAMMHARDTPESLPESVPTPVRLVIANAMAKDPGHRYPDGESFAMAVADVRAGGEPRPPSAFGAAALAAGAAGAGLAAGAGAAGATGPTSVLPDGTPGHSGPGRPDPTRAYTQMQQGRPPQTAAHQAQGPRTQQGPPAAAPGRRHPAPPTTSRPPRKRRGFGCAAWFLVIIVLLALLAVAGAIALSNSGVFGPDGLFGRNGSSSPTTSQTTTVRVPAPTPTPEPAPQPEPTPTPTQTPTRTSEPSPGPSPGPGPTTDLQDMLDSLTSELNDALPPPPAGNNGGGGNAQGRAGGPAGGPAGGAVAAPAGYAGDDGNGYDGRGGDSA